MKGALLAGESLHDQARGGQVDDAVHQHQAEKAAGVAAVDLRPQAGAVEQGARAIFLNLPRGAYVLPGSTDRVSIQAANPHFLSRDTRHPLVAGFEPFDFRLWFDEKEDMITPLANGKFGGAGWDTILKAQGINAVAERAAGRGRVILCEAFLSDRIGANPPARIFADRLLTEK